MNELSKNLLAIVMRNGVEIWLEEERANNIMTALAAGGGTKFVKVGGEFINTADVLGIFTPETMEANTRRKNGQWQCRIAGTWHDRKEKCDCRDMQETREREKRRRAFYLEKGFYPRE